MELVMSRNDLQDKFRGLAWSKIRLQHFSQTAATIITQVDRAVVREGIEGTVIKDGGVVLDKGGKG